MFLSSIKGINRLISKRMSNIYSKVTIEKKLTFSKLQFSKFKKFGNSSVFWELQLMQISLNFKTSCYNLKVRGLGSRSCGLFFYFSFERYYDVVKSKNPCFFKNINFN